MEKKNIYLLALLGFFASWGEGMQKVISSPSLFFPILAFLVIVFNFKYLKVGFTCIPRSYKLLLIFVLIHTFVFICLNPSVLSFGRTTSFEGDNNFQFYSSNSGDVLLRYFLFATLSFILPPLFTSKNLLKSFLLGFAVGFSITILLGGYSADYDDLMRVSGGHKDPNAMAIDGLISICSILHLLREANTKMFKRVLYVLLAISVAAVFISMSRGAILTLCVIILACFFKQGKQRIIKSLLLGLPIIVIGMYFVYVYMVPGEIKDLIELRFSINEMKTDGGAGRTEIWMNYLRNWKDFAFLGTGLSNSMSVLAENNIVDLRVTHNQCLKFFVEFGFVSLFRLLVVR